MTAALVLGGIGLVVAATLSLARAALARRETSSEDAVIDAVDALLPQSQCAQCGHPGCRPYAQAVAAGGPLDLCLPGGPDTTAKLEALLGRVGESTAIAAPEERIARIVEQHCVGCTRCIDACPVDAIVGAHNYLHAVLAEHCTGCELCVPACPVDCIELVPWTPK